MNDFARELLHVNIDDEMQRSYLDYAMSVIVGRALPDARDGLKPVQRRVLFGMFETSNVWNRPYVKCARVVGEVMGKYHPHGDSAIYDTMVRMAQTFSLRHPLIDGQGNFGSIDGDNAAAMRYTECRLTQMSSSVLADIDEDTVDFVANYDGKEHEPTVLPTRIPNLLVNGSAGIAVGMATNIPPHNLGETVAACVALLDDPEIDLPGIMRYLPAPDFPTAGLMLDAAGLSEAYRTGRGRIVLRARAGVEDSERGGVRQRIVVTELPYQVNKARLLERIAELVKDKVVEGISEIRDESDKDGIRMVVELKRGENAEVLLNQLYQHTQMQVTFGINMVALDNGQPRTLGVKRLLEIFLAHRREVVTRRTLHRLKKARERAHVLEGLAVALANIDDVIALIRASKTSAEAKVGLLDRLWQSGGVTAMLERAGADVAASRPRGLPDTVGLVAGGYRLSEAQADAILELRLNRLTGLEQDKLFSEYAEVLAQILDYLDILGSDERLTRVVRAELVEIGEKFANPRRTEITDFAVDMSDEDLIPPQDMVVTLSHEGYVKAQPLSEYRAQRRGGRGRTAATTKETDYVKSLWVAHSHDTLMCFTTRGKAYWLRVFALPTGSAGSRGKPFVNLLPLEAGEKVTAMLPVKGFDTGGYVFMATRRGTVKKTPLEDFSRPRTAGIIAVDLRLDDELVGVALTGGADDILLFSDSGRVIRFSEAGVRSMGRGATGVRGMRLAAAGGGDEAETDGAPGADVEDAATGPDDVEAASVARVIALIVVPQGTKAPGTGEGEVAPAETTARAEIMTVSECGFGKRTPIEQFPLRGRGGQGVIAQSLSERTGQLIGALEIAEHHDVMLLSDAAHLIRIRGAEVKSLGRNTQGVRLARPSGTDRLVAVDRIAIDLAAGLDAEAEDEAAVVAGATPEGSGADTEVGAE